MLCTTIRAGGCFRDYHQASGLVLYRYRAYDPNLQRWLNEDPIGEEGGLNLYAAVGNDPLNRIDPWGLDVYIEIVLITWLQKRTPPQMQGRMMSLAMFVTMGLTPISTPIAGALVKLNPTLFLLITGTLAAALSLVAALNFLVREKNMTS